MTSVADLLEPRGRYARSVNIERDSRVETSLDGYILTPRATDLVQRIAMSVLAKRSLAWSVTGPYGAGKSSFARFLLALAGPSRDPSYRKAFAALEEAHSELAKTWRGARGELGVGQHGLLRIAVTARREPIGLTLLRGMQETVRREWNSGRRPQLVRRVLDEYDCALQGHLDEGAIVDHLRGLAQLRPILLVLDELGKNLEYAADRTGGNDLFLLQELAERLAADPGYPVLVLTLQHVAFDEYASLLSGDQLREWTKVHGRFEDVSFVDGPNQMRRLIADAFAPRDGSNVLDRVTAEWSRNILALARRLRISLDAVAPDEVAKAFPLHPVTLMVLPELCSRYGQNDRTLFTFLTGPEEMSAPRYLADMPLSEAAHAAIRLDRVYDYFVRTLGTDVAAADSSGRWLEIQSALREVTGLDPTEQAALKTIGVLNLVSRGGSLRASGDILRFALADFRGSVASQCERVDAVIASLVTRGVLTYREFADEYRIWEGTDFDVRAAIAEERDQLANASFVDLLQTACPLSPIVAARHSQDHAVLRYFERRYVYDVNDRDFSLADADADGLVVYALGGVDTRLPSTTREGRPLVFIATPDTILLKEAALQAASTTRALRAHDGSIDNVARNELAHRAAAAQALLGDRVNEAFRPGRDDVVWFVKGRASKAFRDGRGLSAVLSKLCDSAYSDTPFVPNEMLHRRELTSQGAKARRMLMEAMILHEGEAHLGLEGYGPERAMYEALLGRSGIHQEDKNGFRFGPPSSASLAPAWNTIRTFFGDCVDEARSLASLYRALEGPPLGMKEGAIPCLILATLLHWNDQIAIYQEGSYQPLLTVDLIERLVRIPERFTVRWVATDGARRSALAAIGRHVLRDKGSSPSRNPSVLGLVRPLMMFVHGWPQYTVGTRSLPESALGVRAALISTREPDQLLFSELPAALGFEPITATSKPTVGVVAFANALGEALICLNDAYQGLLRRIEQRLVDAFVAPGRDQPVRDALRATATIVDSELVSRSELRSFLLMCTTDTLDDREWLEAVATNIVGVPPNAWRDEDEQTFYLRLGEMVAALKRLEALYFEAGSHVASDGFDAKRITLTEPDGQEVAKVVWVDDRKSDALEELVDQMLSRVEGAGGAAGAEMLLSVLARRVLQPVVEPEKEVTGVTAQKGTRP